MSELPGKRIILSGGTTGVGRATARHLARNGAKLYIFGRRPEPLEETLRLIQEEGGEAYGSTADTSDYTSLVKVFEEAKQALGGIDVLINNAALPANNIFNTPPEEWSKVLNVNLLGYMYCSRLAVEHMSEQGHGQILNIGSLCIQVLDNGCDIYVASKTGVAGFTASLRKEVASKNIIVTLLNPGQIASEMVSENKEEKEVAIEKMEMLRPEDVAEAIAYCLSQPERIAVTDVSLRPRGQSHL